MAIFAAGHVLQREVFNFLGVSLLFGSMIQYALSHRHRWLAFLDFSGFYVISRLSYGMYLNHEYMQDGVARISLDWLPFIGTANGAREMAGSMLLYFVSTVFSVVTYCLIEHPFLQLREIALSRNKNNAAPIKIAEFDKGDTATVSAEQQHDHFDKPL